MTAQACAACLQPAAWPAWSASRGWHDLCHSHYAELRAETVARLLQVTR